MRIFKIIFLLVILISFCFLIKATDLSKAISSLKMVGGNFSFLLVTTFLAYLLGTVAWKFCFGKESKKLSLINLFFVRHVGETLALINPTGIIAGEALKVYLINDKGISRNAVLTSVLISRMVMMSSQVMLFLIAAIFAANAFDDIKFHLPQFSTIFIYLIASFFYSDDCKI